MSAIQKAFEEWHEVEINDEEKTVVIDLKHREYFAGMKVGKEQGIAFAVDYVRALALSAFNSHRDDDARKLRTLADAISALNA